MKLTVSKLASIGTILSVSFAILLSRAIGRPQQDSVEHAPTAEQCRADSSVWVSELNDQAAIDGESFRILSQRVSEMQQCASVDSKNRIQYYITGEGTQSEQAARLGHFLSRHSLYDQFLQEDSEGKR